VSVTAYFWRYKAEQSQEFESVDEAVRFLAWGEDAGLSRRVTAASSVATDECSRGTSSSASCRKHGAIFADSRGHRGHRRCSVGFGAERTFGGDSA